LDAGEGTREGGVAVGRPDLAAARVVWVGADQELGLAFDRDLGRVVEVGSGVGVGDEHSRVVAVVEADAE
jgi:hypothetical protein